MTLNRKGTRTEVSNPTGPTELSVQVLEKNTKTHSSTITNKKSLKVESELFIHTKNYEIYVLLDPLGE
jgi:hypothetical protein